MSNALPAPVWAAEDTLSGGTIVQEEQEESTPAISEQAVEDTSEGGTIVQEEQEKPRPKATGSRPTRAKANSPIPKRARLRRSGS
ncbi:MAG: hypothetical protein ACLTXL_10050 [Clostridia bacterium]